MTLTTPQRYPADRVALRELLGADPVYVSTIRGTPLVVPDGTQAQFADTTAVGAWRTTHPNGKLSAIDLWALRNGLVSRIGPDARAAAKRPSPADRRSAAIRDTEAAAATFIRTLPYGPRSKQDVVRVDTKWVEAELLATRLVYAMRELRDVPFGPVDPLERVLLARQHRLWDIAISNPSGKARTRPVTASRFLVACRRAGIEDYQAAAAVAALERCNPHAYSFEVKQRRNPGDLQPKPSVNHTRFDEAKRSIGDSLRKGWDASAAMAVDGTVNATSNSKSVHIERHVDLRPKDDLTSRARRERAFEAVKVVIESDPRGLVVIPVQHRAAVDERSVATEMIVAMGTSSLAVTEYAGARYVVFKIDALDADAVESPSDEPEVDE